MAGGLEQGSWGLGRVSKGVGGWGLERAEGLGSGGRGAGPSRDVRTDVRTDGRSDVRKFPPVFYRTSSSSVPLPKSTNVLFVPSKRLNKLLKDASSAFLHHLFGRYQKTESETANSIIAVTPVTSVFIH